MLATHLVTHGVKHVLQNAREGLYLNSSVDITRPISIVGQVNEKCNYKCQMCAFWRLDAYKDEMSIEEWKAALTSLKQFVGEYAIQFVGGEPFIKKDFVELLAFCSDQGIRAGVITNGSCFTAKIAAATIAARPLNVDISVDGASAEVHDDLRGMPGSFDAIRRGIQHLLRAQEDAGHRVPLRIKPTINALNFHEMSEMVHWALRVGATSIDFEPMRTWTRETKEHLWIRGEALEGLEREVDRVLSLKRQGAPIETSEGKLRRFADHFRGVRVEPEVTPCRVGLRDYHIGCDGNVNVCWSFPPIGNVKHQSARDIWLGEKARKVRQETVVCEVGCAFSCLAHRPLKDTVKAGLMLLRASAKPPRKAGCLDAPGLPKPGGEKDPTI